MLEIRHRHVHDGMTVKDAYDEMYVDTDLSMRDSYYLWMLDLLQADANSLLLDVACGQGRLVELASARGVPAIGTDISAGGLMKGARNAPDALWVVADGVRIPLPDGSIDLIVSSGSLEHYDDPLAGVREISRLLKADGRAAVLLPNAYGVFGNIQHVWQHGEIYDDGQPLQRCATRHTWEMLLNRGGLVVEQLVPFNEVNFPRTYDDARWLMRRPLRMTRGLLAQMVPPHMANQLVFLCRRAEESGQALYNPMWPAL